MSASPLIGRSLDEIDTPALLIDSAALDRNIARMAGLVASSGGATYRPHTKTHKSPLIARCQIEAGARGVCCAKLGEAEVMVQEGIGDVLITTPITGRVKIDRLVALAARARVAVVADDETNIRQLSDAAQHQNATLDVLVEVNVGQNRCGVAPGPEAARLARTIADAKGLRFRGLQGYQGSLQGLAEYGTRAGEVRKALDRLQDTANEVSRVGITIETLTGGGTGSSAIDIALGGLTELQPGSYVFMDASYRKLQWNESGAAIPFEPALFVLGSVVSRPARDRAVIDVGWKTASCDSGPPSSIGLPDVAFAFAGDEHGILQSSAGAIPLAHGDKVRLQPSHCDTTVNLYDDYVVIKDGIVQDVWKIAARGRSQ